MKADEAFPTLGDDAEEDDGSKDDGSDSEK
jgi:hypothetical protein